MTRQDLFNQVADAIKSGDFKCIHYNEKDGQYNIIVTLASNLMCFVNEDGTANILCKGSANMLPISRAELIDMSIEGVDLAEERRRELGEKARQQALEEIKDKLPKWKSQQLILQAKIEEAEQLAANSPDISHLAAVVIPAEHPITPEEAATIDDFKEKARKMVEEAGTPIPTRPLPSMKDMYPDAYDEIKERAQASFKETLERIDRPAPEPWYKRLLKRKDD